MGKNLEHGIAIQGSLPKRSKTRALYIYLFSTPTEKTVLEDFQKEHISDPDASVAWVEDDNTSDPLKRAGIVEALKSGENLNVVPIGIAWKPKSEGEQSWREIMSWTRLIDSNRRQQRVLKNEPHRCVVVVGEPGMRKTLRTKFDRFVSIGAGTSDKELSSFADFVALQAGLTIERDARQATGQTIKYPRFVKRSIWARRDFQAGLQEIADQNVRNFDDVLKEAKESLDELVPTIRAPHVSFSTIFARRVCRLGYDEDLVYDKKEMQKIRDLVLTRPTAIVWTHKTHIDGLAMILASRLENFPLIHLIGGANMAFAGVGYLMKRSGTVFIRRKIESDVYKMVMRYYLSYLMEKRFPVSWALEGTRSRNGKLMPPRFGILKYVVEAAAKENTKNLTVVPVSIYYDLIAEIGDYAREQAGTTKRKESLAWFMDYLRTLRKPLGRISFGIGDPIVVDTSRKAFTQAIQDDSEKFSIELQKIAFDASVSANAATPMTPSSIIALVLTGAAPKALVAEEMIREAVKIIRWAKARKLPMTEELYDLKGDKVREIARSMIEIGVVSAYEGGHETVYSINPDKQFEASYYRNTAIHFFVNKAIIEVALAAAAEEDKSTATARFWKAVLRLRDIFKFEFFYPDAVTYQNDIKAEMARYDPAWEQHLDEGRAQSFLKKMSPHVAHSVLRAFTEAYSIVGDVLLERGNNAVTDKEIIEDCLKRGKQAMLQRRITSEESIGKLMFSNGVKLAANYDLLSDGLGVGRQRYVDDMNDIMRYLGIIGGIANERREWVRGVKHSSHMKTWLEKHCWWVFSLVLSGLYFYFIFGAKWRLEPTDSYILYSKIMRGMLLTCISLGIGVISFYSLIAIRQKSSFGKPFEGAKYLIFGTALLLVFSAIYLLFPSDFTLIPLEFSFAVCSLFAAFLSPFFIGVLIAATITKTRSRRMSKGLRFTLFTFSFIFAVAGISAFVMPSVYWPGKLYKLHEMDFESALWKGVDPKEIPKVNVRRKMLKDVMDNVLPGSTCKQLETELGQCEFLSKRCDDHKEGSSNICFYALGGNPGNMWMDDDYLQINFDEDGRYKSHPIYNWD